MALWYCHTSCVMPTRAESLPDSATLPITVRVPVADVRRIARLVEATRYASRNQIVADAIRHGLVVLEEITPPAPTPLPRQCRRGQPKGTKCQ